MTGTRPTAAPVDGLDGRHRPTPSLVPKSERRVAITDTSTVWRGCQRGRGEVRSERVARVGLLTTRGGAANFPPEFLIGDASSYIRTG
ncbi:hypothetical protein FRAHR75_270061 [Frankia sp. Hr75.2]|nr:hypothetical protein FRAHR75_270061 [Frankia sp. Hr75.2]